MMWICDFLYLFHFFGCPTHLTYSITLCMHLAVAVSSGLIAVGVKTFTGFTVAGSTCRAAPPTTRTLLLDPTNTHTHTVRFDQIPMYLGQIWHGERDSTTQREREMEPTDKREQMRLPLLWRIWLSVCEFEVGVELGSHESQSVGKLKSTFIHSKPANLKHTRIHAAKQNKCIINMNTNSFAIHIQSYR